MQGNDNHNKNINDNDIEIELNYVQLPNYYDIFRQHRLEH